jgi:hypothetical protein
MAVQHDYDAGLTLATVDLSDHCTAVEVIERSPQLDTSAFGSIWDSGVGGTKSFVLTCTLRPDQAAAEVSATLEALVGTTVAFTANQDNTTATGATNREWAGSVTLTEFKHLGASRGTVGAHSYSWPGTGTLTTNVA